jgi:phosphoenolpyruvate---glycerone phosphotransferase subunit DhaL
MAESLTTDGLKRGLSRIAAKMEACKEELNALDGEMGDGDIGITMSVGFANVMQLLDELSEDVGMALVQCAQAFVKGRASSYGTLLATGLMAAGKAVKGQKQVAWSAVPGMLGEAIEKMALRGKSALGDKTVLDALEAARISAEGADKTPEAMLEAVLEGVGRSVEEFRTRPCRQGRARIFTDRNATIYDPGMVALKRMIEGLAGKQATEGVAD